MNLTIHVQGNADSKDDVHFYITRGGFMEERMTRHEFKAVVNTLHREALRLAQVKPGGDLEAEVYVPKHHQSL